MRGLLIVGGEAPNAALVGECRASVDVVAAADAGLERAFALGMTPDLFVGDVDSLADLGLLERLPPERKMLFPRDKDETDTEIGLRVLQERGCTDVVIAGGGGGRLDHLLSIAMLFEREKPPCRWITAHEDVYHVNDEADFEGWRGSTISVFPVGGPASRMSSEGLKWPLDGLVFTRGWAGVSNVATADRVRIRVGGGRLLVIRLLNEVR